MPRVMIVEDQKDMVKLMSLILKPEAGFDCFAVMEPERILPEARAKRPDLVLLDLRLGRADGRHNLRELKADPATRDIPVLIVSGLVSAADKVLGLELGADDYIPKPFEPLEFLARVKTALRRRAPAASAVVAVKDLQLDPGGRTATLAGEKLELQPREFEILYLMLSKPGHAFTRQYLLENTTSGARETSQRTLDAHIKNIRRKLGSRAGLIETVSKVGYKVVTPS